MSSEQAITVQTATPESVRQVNRSVLLGLARRLAPVSRAELARRSGIVPSSVSRIVEELIEEGMLTEARAVPAGRGKVPMLLRIRDEHFYVLGIYVQPIETTIAFAGFTGRVLNSWSFPTPQSPKEFIQQVNRRLRTIRGEMGSAAGGIRHIGIGVPGFVDATEGRVTCVSTLPEYSGYPIVAELERATGVPVSLDNDCNLGALSELRRMEEHEETPVNDFVFLSIGDFGVGAGVILNGELYRGHDARFAAEVGHMIVEREGPPCACGRRGCFEMLVSNSATWKRYRPRTQFTRERFRDLLRAVCAGKADAMAAVAETARYIALTSSNIATLLNPAEIVLAGEITEAFPVICKAVATLYQSPYARVKIRSSQFPKEVPLLHGTVCLALSGAMPPPAFGPGKAKRPKSQAECCALRAVRRRVALSKES